MIEERELNDTLCGLSDRERTVESLAASLDPAALSYRGACAWVAAGQTAASVIIRLGNRLVLLRSASPNVFLPLWVKPVLQSLVPLFRLERNWDSYGALPLNEKTVKSALEVLFSVMNYISPAPSVVPTVTGGLQFEWHTGGIDLEIAIPRPAEGRFIFEDRAGKEIEGELPAQSPQLAALVARLPK